MTLPDPTPPARQFAGRPRPVPDGTACGAPDALARRARGKASVVYSLRLDPGEVVALERRAAVLRMKPSVLARNLVRVGLSSPSLGAVPDALARLEGVVQELRTLLVVRSVGSTEW